MVRQEEGIAHSAGAIPRARLLATAADAFVREIHLDRVRALLEPVCSMARDNTVTRFAVPCREWLAAGLL